MLCVCVYTPAGYRVSEGEQAASESALPSEDLQAAGGGDGRS